MHSSIANFYHSVIFMIYYESLDYCNRLEVNELRQLLSLRRTSDSSGRLNGIPTLDDACTELEYLRNILYEYMMGKEPVVS